MTTRRPWIVPALWTTASSAVPLRASDSRTPNMTGGRAPTGGVTTMVSESMRYASLETPVPACGSCRSRGRTERAHRCLQNARTRFAQLPQRLIIFVYPINRTGDYNRARTQGGINPTDSTAVATLRRVITITGLGVHDAPESPFKLTGMRSGRRRLT